MSPDRHPTAQLARAMGLLRRVIACALIATSCGGERADSGGGSGNGAGGAQVGVGGKSGASGTLAGGPPAGIGGAASGGASGEGGLAGHGGTGGEPSMQANVIFILTDDLAWNLVEYMPHVQEMQKHGVTFSNYFVTDSLCCPSRTSMFTGRYPHNSGVFTNSGDDGGYATYLRMGNDPQTFAVALETVGYRTAMLGKFLNGYTPMMDPPSLGWSEWDVAGNGYPEFDYDLNQNGKLVSYGATPADYLTDVLSQIAQKFIENSSPNPFLLELATFTPHAPYVPAPRHADLFPGLVYPRTVAFDARPSPSDPTWLQAVPPLTDQNIANIDNFFRMRAQDVQAIDEMIGALEAALKSSGHDQDTYLFFASDNGFHMGERSLRPGKQTAFDTDIRVPLIVTGPGVPLGVALPQIVQNIDLCPTFSELARTPPPKTMNGHSLVPLLWGQEPADWRNVALVEHHDAKFDPSDPDVDTTGNIQGPPTYEALRTADSVYVEYVGRETEYHDHATDPLELYNTAAQLSPDQVAKFHTAIAAIETCKTSAECWAAQHLAP